MNQQTAALIPDDATVTERAAWQRLDFVIDPEIGRPVTELGMIEAVTESHSDGALRLGVDVRLTIAGCPLREKITSDIELALSDLPNVGGVDVNLKVMTPQQRADLTESLNAGRPSNPFGKGTLTQIFAVASGKGGVGKSSVTANLAAGFAKRGLAVGLVDADIHGFSIPDLFGTSAKPTNVDEMILPPAAHGVKMISIGMFFDGNQPVAWRGPMLHRALEQFLSDVFWGDLDVLFIDLPPGTGDIALSAAQLMPESELLIVTTPQQAAAQVAARAGQLTLQTGQAIAGVIENMAAMTLPDGTMLDLFGTGGGEQVAQRLSELTDAASPVPMLGSIPLDPVLRTDGDFGTPSVLQHPEAPGAREMNLIIDQLITRPRGLLNRFLPISPHSK